VPLADGEAYTISVNINNAVAKSSNTSFYATCGPLAPVGPPMGRWNLDSGSHPTGTTGDEHYFTDVTVDYDSDPPPDPDPTTAAVMQLSEADRQRLDLIWIGVFLFAGLTFGFAFARSAWGEVRQWFHFSQR